jgi:hypothetical protein
VFTIKIKDNAPFGSFKVTNLVSIANGSKKVEYQLVEDTLTIECAHSYGDWTNKDAANHEKTCTVCGKAVPEAHKWN